MVLRNNPGTWSPGGGAARSDFGCPSCAVVYGGPFAAIMLKLHGGEIGPHEYPTLEGEIGKAVSLCRILCPITESF